MSKGEERNDKIRVNLRRELCGEGWILVILRDHVIDVFLSFLQVQSSWDHLLQSKIQHSSIFYK